ncbi:MAG: general secretion pathway protein GspK [Alphaproteobacteria bacterium]|nr:general secretion pathway protein GspK [Alphaproteobacteria bacterium]MBU2377568.1 general secretion pathway protein GspK [Alphaproteobacteria bacterium]
MTRSRGPAPRAPGRPAGFVLPTVLVVTSVVTLIFLVAITALASLNREAGLARARVTFAQQAMTAEARLTYLGATERVGPRSLAIDAPLPPGEFETLDPERLAAFQAGMANATDLRLDNRPYRYGSSAIIRLQDQAGMVNLSRLSGPALRRLLARLNVSAAGARSLEAALADYADPDDLRTSGGAERGDYPDGSDAPANRPLRTADEFLNVLGAREAVDMAAWREMRPFLAADATSFQVNVNTADFEALRILFGMSEAQARAAIRGREVEPFYSLAQAVADTGAALDTNPEIGSVYPSGRIIYTIEDSLSRWTYTGRLNLTPTNVERPFWIDRTEYSEARRPDPEPVNAPEFPAAPR